MFQRLTFAASSENSTDVEPAGTVARASAVVAAVAPAEFDDVLGAEVVDGAGLGVGADVQPDDTNARPSAMVKTGLRMGPLDPQDVDEKPDGPTRLPGCILHPVRHPPGRADFDRPGRVAGSTIAAMHGWWYRNIYEPGKLPVLLGLAAFVFTFLITRLITRSIRAGRGPFRDSVSAGGLHVHHAVPGIIALVIGAFTAISAAWDPWLEIGAVLIGIGTSLVLDEFALILHLKDVYWTNQGRVSVELVGLAAAVLLFLSIGLVPLGVDDASLSLWTVRLTLTSSFWLNVVLAVVCVLKAKYRFALFGVFLPFLAWAPAVRLARPESIWALRFYRAKRLTKARMREQKFDLRWDPKWIWLGDFIAGTPNGEVPASRSPAPMAGPAAGRDDPERPIADLG